MIENLWLMVAILYIMFVMYMNLLFDGHSKRFKRGEIQSSHESLQKMIQFSIKIGMANKLLKNNVITAKEHANIKNDLQIKYKQKLEEGRI